MTKAIVWFCINTATLVGVCYKVSYFDTLLPIIAFLHVVGDLGSYPRLVKIVNTEGLDDRKALFNDGDEPLTTGRKAIVFGLRFILLNALIVKGSVIGSLIFLGLETIGVGSAEAIRNEKKRINDRETALKALTEAGFDA